MIRIILSEADRDRRLIIFSLLFFPVLFVASCYLEPYQRSFEIFCEIMIIVFAFPLPFVFAGLTFRVQRNDQSHEYFLSLNLARWKVWLAKLLYLVILILVLDGVIFLFIGAMSLREASLTGGTFHSLRSYPDDLILYYYLLGICVLSLFGALPRLDRPGLFLILGTVVLGGVILYDTYRGQLDWIFFTDHQLYFLPLAAGVLLLLTSICAFLYCRYRLNRKTFLELSGIFIGACLAFYCLQWTYSTVQLSSSQARERARAVSVFIAVDQPKAIAAIDDVLPHCRSRDDIDFFRQILLSHASIMEKMRPTWRKGVMADNYCLRLISLECSASIGRDPELASMILKRLETDYQYRWVIGSNVWADAIALLTPREGLHDIVVSLLSSNQTEIREIGYELAKYDPHDDYVPLVIMAVRKPGDRKDLMQACRLVSVISTGAVNCEWNRDLDQPASQERVESLTRKWEQWYEQRPDKNFPARSERRLAELGIKGGLESLSDQDLLALDESYLCQKAGLEGVVNKMLKHRLNIIDIWDYGFGSRWETLAMQKLGLTDKEIRDRAEAMRETYMKKMKSSSP